MENYYSCCGKSVCRGCLYSFCESGNEGKCPFCNSDGDNKTAEEMVEEIRERAEANDPGAMCVAAEKTVFPRIRRRQWIFTLGQQGLVIMWRIMYWLAFIIEGGI